jgi:CBS domain-containing protein
MVTPVISVSEATEAGETARLLIAHRIKRVPVLRDGGVGGIVSRADLVRTIADKSPKPILESGGLEPTAAIVGAGSQSIRRARQTVR